jgi:SRSO17 transposase
MVDAELFLPEVWFDGEHRKMWKRLHIPPERTFATKPQIGLEMILRAKANGLPFSMVSADELYGRSDSFRRRLDEEGITYIVDIPNDSVVYLEKPVVCGR